MVADDGCALKYAMYQSPSKTNVEIDDAPTPTAVVYCVTDWDVRTSTGVVRESARVGIGFVTRQTEFEFDGIQNEALIDEMKNLALHFFALMKDRDDVTIASDKITCKSIYNDYDTNVTGVWCDVDIVERGGKCIAYYDED